VKQECLALCVSISQTVRDNPKLLLMTNEKLGYIMRFSLAPRSMTLDDLGNSNFLGILQSYRHTASANKSHPTEAGKPRDATVNFE